MDSNHDDKNFDLSDTMPKQMDVLAKLSSLHLRINTARYLDPCPLKLDVVKEAIEKALEAKKVWMARVAPETSKAVIEACDTAINTINKQSYEDRVVTAIVAARAACAAADASPLLVTSNIYVKQAIADTEEALKEYRASETEETAQLVVERSVALIKLIDETTEGFKKLRVIHALEGLQIRINSAKHSDPCPLNLPAVQAAIETAGALKRQWEANPTDETAQAVVDACQNARALI